SFYIQFLVFISFNKFFKSVYILCCSYFFCCWSWSFFSLHFLLLFCWRLFLFCFCFFYNFFQFTFFRFLPFGGLKRAPLLNNDINALAPSLSSYRKVVSIFNVFRNTSSNGFDSSISSGGGV